MKGITFLLVLVTSLAVKSVWASVPVFGTTAESKRAQQFTAPADKAVIYLYQLPRDGKGVSPRIWLNNYEIGRLVPGSFSVWKLSPGHLRIHIEGTDRTSVSMISQAGKVYLFRLTVTQTRSGPQTKITSLPESFRYDLRSTKLLKNPRTVTRIARSQPARPKQPVKRVTPTVPVQPPKPAKSVTPKQPTVTAKAPTTTPVEETELQAEEETSPYREPSGVNMLLKTGVITLSEESQSLLGTDLIYDDSASGVLAIEGYYQFDSGFTIGGELLKYSAEFTTVGSNQVHNVDVLAVMGTAKKFFRVGSSLQPYIGAGLGFATTDISGPSFGGNTSGVAYQLMAGLEYRSDSIGVFGEFKMLSADTEDDGGESVDVSGTGLFAGVAFHF